MTLDKLTISALDRLEAVGGFSLFNQLTPSSLADMASILHLDKCNWVNPRFMFEEWLSSYKSSHPPTWDSLLEVLPRPLAREVNNFLTKMTPGRIPSLTASLVCYCLLDVEML